MVYICIVGIVRNKELPIVFQPYFEFSEIQRINYLIIIKLHFALLV